MPDDDREYLIGWTLARAGDEEDCINIFLWENGEDVSVVGGRGEAGSWPDGEQYAEDLIKEYATEGYTEVHRDPASGYHACRFYDED